ncbi:hypothetical protein V7150_10735 [Neobacillus drentensis]|uniref:TlpA family protein disulfide reductase n=1 Tax=Neobacillus drentensis TaxID=220684 RepID=UPI002FFE7A46
MITDINLILILIVLLFLLLVIKDINNIDKAFLKKKKESIQTSTISKKVNSVEVYNGEGNLDIKTITSSNLLGIIISSSCPACMPHFENFLNISSQLISPKDYYVFLHEDDHEAKEYLSLIQQDFQILFYKDNFIRELEVDFLPVFFLLDKDGIIKILTPIEQQFISKLTNFGLISA